MLAHNDAVYTQIERDTKSKIIDQAVAIERSTEVKM